MIGVHAEPDMSLFISAFRGDLGVPSEAERSEQHSGSSEYRHFNFLITEMGVTVGIVAVTALVLERQKLIGGSCH